MSRPLQVFPDRTTVLPGALVRREQTAPADFSTPERAKMAADTLTQQVRDLAAGSGILQRGRIYRDLACTAGSTIVVRHNFGGPADWIPVRWVPTSAGDASELSEDPAPTADANTHLTLYTPNAGTVSVLVF